MKVSAEVEAAIRAEGMTEAEVELISPLGSRKDRRPVYRVDGEGRTVKLRLLESNEVADELERISGVLDAAFVPITARHGRVTVEPWVDGDPVDGVASSEAERAAAALARLHAGSVEPARTPGGESRWLREAESDLQMLLAADLIEPEAAPGIRGRLAELHAGTAAVCVIHRDFCAENLIVDRSGELRVIDNEWLAIGPPAYDLGRTLQRWPMSADAWDGFTTAYAEVAGEPEDLELWTLAAALFSARVAHQRAPEQLDRALALIRDGAP